MSINSLMHCLHELFPLSLLIEINLRQTYLNRCQNRCTPWGFPTSTFPKEKDLQIGLFYENLITIIKTVSEEAQLH